MQLTENSAKIVVYSLTAVVLGLVAFMYISPGFVHTFDAAFPNFDKSVFPKFHATLNALVSFFLISALVFIKKRNVTLHKISTLTATILSSIFLVSYVVYHNISETTKYGGEGFMKAVYLFILLTHIVCAAGVFPFIMFTLLNALTNNFDKHKKLARYTFPVWLYVAVTGVLVYLMISPYYK